VNAATLSISKRFVDVTLEELRRAHAVNFLAPTRLSQAAVPGMKQRRCGHIVNITSIWGDVIRPDVSVLAATKAALASATAALAHECASASVRVNSVAVGPIEEDGFDDLRAKMPMGRFVKASEVADIVLWMTAADSSAVTGQNVVADGGLSRFC
jgi:NAD(P)-dependent dehydrogenase (short-subunit alcohol dehydrogenase family)